MLDELLKLKKLLMPENKDLIPHVASDLGIKRYIKNANKIKYYLPKGKILDWGCGLGQMTYLLKNRNFEVVSYDLDAGGRSFLGRIGQQLVLGHNPIKLPFPDSEFDAILSSGVFEHVTAPLESLKETSRILKRGGYIFVFMLPNKYSYIEYFSDRLGRGDHPVKYSINEICAIFKKYNYEIISIKYQGFLPYNFKGFPLRVRKFYHLFDKLIEKIDTILSNIPILNIFCTNIELVARKK